jgi:hypothetical protein
LRLAAKSGIVAWLDAPASVVDLAFAFVAGEYAGANVKSKPHWKLIFSVSLWF